MRPAGSRIRLSASVDVLLLAAAACAAFRPVLQNGFVNWDDPIVLIHNPHLAGPGVIEWAFSTTLIGHYQPLAWLVWSATKAASGLSATRFHALSLTLHVANGVLVYLVAVRLAQGRQMRAAGLLAGLLFLLHPTSVETVAWASAFPYILSAFGLLLSVLAYMRRWMAVAIACYAASLLARATALGYPFILPAIDSYLLNPGRARDFRQRLVEKVPFAVLATLAAIAEWRSRDVASLQEIGLGPRLTMVATAPFVYAWRTLWPVRLSPLDVLPIAPHAAPLLLAGGVASLGAITIALWRWRTRSPALRGVWVVWFAWLVLLAPVAGFTPSGLQATADRYLYLPSIVFAVALGSAVAARMTAPRTVAAASAVGALAAAIVVLGMLTWQQTRYWTDSITLWTRAAEIDPRNDVATYNLAVALAEAGRDQDALGWYDRTIALVPDHDLARQNAAHLRAAAAERNADGFAAAGRTDEAIDDYSRSLDLDPRRSHARAARGMLMLKRGKLREAIEDLGRAIDEGVKDVEVPNGLAFALVQLGESAQAVAVLDRAVGEHPDNINLEHNLARLLATAPDPRVRDAARAVQLAQRVCDQTGNRDPRALDTLSAAYAAAGRLNEARSVALRAIERARQLGDEETAAQIAAHARSYRPE